MYKEYKKAVLKNYHELKNGGKLSSRLASPSPANLKEECVQVFSERFSKRDEKALIDFFGKKDDSESWSKIISKCDIDKFRSLGYYLNGRLRSTGDPNVEILAWLIEFEGRPYDYSKGWPLKNHADEPENKTSEEVLIQNAGPVIQDEFESGGVAGKEVDVIAEGKSDDRQNTKVGDHLIEGTENSVEGKSNEVNGNLVAAVETKYNSPQPDQVSSRSIFKKWKATLGSWNVLVPFIFLLIAFVAVYLPNNKRFASGGCMYWAGDHYESISCLPRQGDTVVVALDSQKLMHFKKIDRWDTITYGSINRIWYSKIKNNLEYFTAPGRHPIDRRVTLKPLTAYMIERHIVPLQQVGGVAN